MRSRACVRLVSVVLLLVLSACGENDGGWFRQYEYEEELRLSLDGSASLTVNASIAALVALHGFDLDPSPGADVDTERIGELFASDAARVVRVGRPWRRAGRWFVQVRLDVPDIVRLPGAAPFARSAYELAHRDDRVHFRQVVSGSAGRPVDAGWTGRELAVFSVHLPSRIHVHNATSGRVERGNILAWEQPLAERLAGVPLEMEARMEPHSILFRTITLFALSFAAAVTAIGLGVLWLIRRGRAPARTPQG